MGQSPHCCGLEGRTLEPEDSRSARNFLLLFAATNGYVTNRRLSVYRPDSLPVVALLAVLFWVSLLACEAASATENLVRNPGLESAELFDWVAHGRATTAKRSDVQPHSGNACLYVIDQGEQGGQGDNALFEAPSGMYYAEAWLRVDPERRQTAVFDVQFFGDSHRYLSSTIVGTTASTEWTRVAAFIVIPEGTTAVRLRVMPTPHGQGALHGACFADDFYLAPLDAAHAAGRIGLKYSRVACSNDDSSGRVGQLPPDLADKLVEPRGQIGFEDLSGWTMAVFGNLEGRFCRSREQLLGGRFVGKLTYRTDGEAAWVSLRPPKPIPLRHSYEAAQVWCHSDWHRSQSGSAPQMLVVVNEDGTERAVTLPPFSWPFWSIAHRRLDTPTRPSAQITEIRIVQLCTKKGETRSLFLDELGFHGEPDERLDLAIPDVPCPTVPDGICPTLDAEASNHVEQREGAFRFVSRNKDEVVEYVYRPATGTTGDLTVALRPDVVFEPASGGGPSVELTGEIYVPGDERLTATLMECKLEAGGVSAVWRYAAGGESTSVTWRLRTKGKSLILAVDSDQRAVCRWFLGQPSQAQRIDVPYLTHHCGAGPVWLVGGRAFVHCQPDWYVTHASAFHEDNCEYTRVIDGERPRLHERIFLSVSSDFHEVLPNIPNPKSPVAQTLGTHVYTNMGGSLHGDALDRCMMLWKQMKGLGMDKIIVKHHAHTWSNHSGRGNEPFVQTLRAATNIPGSDQALADYIAQAKALGYEYFLYTDYCIVAPVNAHFDESLVSLGSNGQWKRGWYQYYCLTPLMAPVLAAKFAPRLKAKYGLTGSYCDQHTAPTPSRWVDHDPLKPGAAMLQTVFRSYCRVFEIEKQAYAGPVVSEGRNYWIYAGMVDGNYAQLRTARGQARWQVPFLVDFDLLKIHPREVDLGVGWRESYGYDSQATNRDAALDRFLCATIAFGHSGILYGPNFPHVSAITQDDPLGKWKRSAVRTYFMTQQLASRYALVPVQSIRYWNSSRLVRTSDAVRSGAYQESQVAVEYANGLHVFANGSFKRNWRVSLAGHTYDLPPNGWVAAQGNDFLEYSAVRSGRRVDFVRSPVYTFADGRGVSTDFGHFKATNAMIVLHERGGERHVIDMPMWR